MTEEERVRSWNDYEMDLFSDLLFMCTDPEGPLQDWYEEGKQGEGGISSHNACDLVHWIHDRRIQKEERRNFPMTTTDDWNLREHEVFAAIFLLYEEGLLPLPTFYKDGGPSMTSFVHQIHDRRVQREKERDDARES